MGLERARGTEGKSLDTIRQERAQRSEAAAKANRQIQGALSRQQARHMSLPVSRDTSVTRTLHTGHVTQAHSTNGSAEPFRRAIMKGTSTNRNLTA